MADCGPKPVLTKIVLGITILFGVVMIVGFCVGGPLYFQERFKTKQYVKDSCRVDSTSYEVIDKCTKDSTRGTTYVKCYIPLWQVQIGENETRRETVRSTSENSYHYMETKFDRFKIGSSYPCWYNKNKPSELSWYAPNTYYSLILLIIGAVSALLALISFIGFCRLKNPADI